MKMKGPDLMEENNPGGVRPASKIKKNFEELGV
jgi:hypothetical protein